MKILAAVLVVPLAAAALATGKSDFSGVWEMNVARSTLGPNYPVPKKRTTTIEHREPALKIAVHEIGAREVRQSLAYSTDGKERGVEVQGNAMRTTAVWEGETLVITTWGDFGGRSIRIVDRWSLDQDGRILTVLRNFEGGGRNAGQTLVYEKVK